MSPKLKKGIRWAISAAILVFLILFARTIDWHAAWNSMRHASLPLLAAAIGVNILSVLIKGVRWWLFLRPIGIKSLPLAIRATVAGAGLNNVLVANGGDAARVVFVSRVSGVSSSTVLASLALEKLFDPIGFVILVVFGVLAFQLPPQFERWKVPAELTLVAIVLLLVFFVYATRHIKPEHVPERRARPRPRPRRRRRGRCSRTSPSRRPSRPRTPARIRRSASTRPGSPRSSPSPRRCSVSAPTAAACRARSGSPFAPGSNGNVATEDAVHLFADMGVVTGVNLDRVVEAAKLAEELVGHPVPGQVSKAGPRWRTSPAAEETGAR